MAPTVNNPPYDHSVHKYLPWFHFPIPRNSGTSLKLEGVNVTRARYIFIHFYEGGFYSDMVECLTVDPTTRVRFWLGQVK